MRIADCKEKIKVGDWVRTNGSNNFLVSSGYFEGEIGEIKEDRFYVWQNVWKGVCGNILPSSKGYKYSWEIYFDNPNAEIEILRPAKITEMTTEQFIELFKNIVVHTPTLEDYKRVVGECLKYKTWNSGSREINESYWEYYKDKTCIEPTKIRYYFFEFYSGKGYQILSTPEFFKRLGVKKEESYYVSLEEVNVGRDSYYTSPFPSTGTSTAGTIPIKGRKEIFNKPKKTLMSVIKNIFKTKERKALEFYSIVNGDGGLTDTGRQEFVDYLYQKMEAEKKAFIVDIVAEYEKEKEKK